MSMILDALQRADRERRRDESPAQALPPTSALATPPPVQPRPTGARRKWGLPVAIAGLATAGLLAYWLFRGAEPPEPTPPVEATASAPTPENTAETSITEPQRPGVERLYQAPARPEPSDDSIASLYRRAQAPEPTRPEVTPSEAATERLAPSRDSASVTLNDTPEEPSSSRQEAEPEPQPATTPRPAVPGIRDLSWSLQQDIPSLNYQAHQYREGEGSTVTINQREYRTGDRIATDLRIERIEEDGVVLTFKGQSFKLQALNSWINM
ncbi:general secretion pathway protein GspB [Marinimicrobium sp. LS-A18]|uniref:general secretion pathway protein GspB n=1 Tax=Marinimicrobium sp. LS-A18 TaxID=1381596 RepID=UPI000464986E|nr:general secretion pathway protein GspB [Marinimicrobium sp. LS-A18]